MSPNPQQQISILIYMLLSGMPKQISKLFYTNGETKHLSVFDTRHFLVWMFKSWDSQADIGETAAV